MVNTPQQAQAEHKPDVLDTEAAFENLMREIEETDWKKNLKRHITYYNLQIYKLEVVTPKSIRSLYYKLRDK